MYEDTKYYIERLSQKIEDIYALAQQRTLTNEEAELWAELIDAVSELRLELPEQPLTLQFGVNP
jgi:Na+/phosphate symporter